MRNINILITDNINSFNPFNRVICSELSKKYKLNFSISIEEFWNCEADKYDSIHLQWPEYLVKKNSKEDLLLLEKRLQVFKENHVPIIITYHNSLPHLWSPVMGRKLYSIVYNMCDVVVHLAEYSLGNYEFNLYHNVRQVVIPHPCYLLSEKKDSKKEARLKLGIPLDKNMYLVSGSIRSQLEGKHVISAFDKLDTVNNFLAIPAWEAKIDYQKPLRSPLNAISYGLMKANQVFSLNKRFGSRKISDEDMNAYLSAADVLVVSRVGLNSGVFYLGLAYGVPMICADSGNTGRLAKVYGNITYEYGCVESLLTAMRKRPNSLIGQTNLTYASTNHSVEKITEMYRDLYYGCL